MHRPEDQALGLITPEPSGNRREPFDGNRCRSWLLRRLSIDGLASGPEPGSPKKPLPRTAFGIDTLIVDPHSAHHNRTGGLQHRTLVVIAVAHH
jgi:hypothetical protein